MRRPRARIEIAHHNQRGFVPREDGGECRQLFVAPVVALLTKSDGRVSVIDDYGDWCFLYQKIASHKAAPFSVAKGLLRDNWVFAMQFHVQVIDS